MTANPSDHATHPGPLPHPKMGGGAMSKAHLVVWQEGRGDTLWIGGGDLVKVVQDNG